MVHIHHEPLEFYVKQIFHAAGVPPSRAALAANSVISAHLRGIDSHGVQLVPHYIRQIEIGNMDPVTEGAVATRSAGCASYDAQKGLGQTVAAICCDLAVDLAREYGTGTVTVREGNHFGICAYWAQRMADAGMIGIVMCNATPLVAPWQGKDKKYGTNPICMAVPGPRTWLLDMATTTVALNKINKALLCGQPTIPAGWAMDSEGNPTTDTRTAYEGLPMPLGGYKGSGLAIMVEVLCAVLSGGAMLTQVGGLRVLDRPMRIGQFFLAMDVARFMPLNEFSERMQWLRTTLKGSAPAAGYDEVLVAGDPEWRYEEHRRAHGFEIEQQVWDSLSATARRLGIEPPAITRRIE